MDRKSSPERRTRFVLSSYRPRLILITCAFQTTVIVTDPEPDLLEDVLRRQRLRDFLYTFDSTFGSEAQQEEVYEKSTKWLINGVVEKGYNGTVFAYGATGTGAV